MAEKISIIGGSSSPGEIKIMSSEFVSTARYNGQGIIETHLAKQPKITNFLYNHKKIPIPKSFKLVLHTFSNAPILNGAYLLGLIFFHLVKKNTASLHRPSAFATITSWPASTGLTVLIAGLALFLIYRFVATWHAAEHMAIAAYQNDEKTDLETIARQSRIDDRCGGRFVLPLIIGGLVSSVVAYLAHLSPLITQLVTLEGILWIDARWGLGTIPIMSHASRALQRHLTTRQPGSIELQTAQAALQRLIRAHA